jgi:hypothetical protein
MKRGVAARKINRTLRILHLKNIVVTKGFADWHIGFKTAEVAESELILKSFPLTGKSDIESGRIIHRLRII